MALTQSYGIKAAVGSVPGSTNHKADVEIIQKLLNEHASKAGFQKLATNGVPSPQLVEAIKSFQKKVVGMKVPDGRVDPTGTTLKKLNEPATSTSFTPTVGKSPYPDVFSHPDASKVTLKYNIQDDGKPVVPLNAKAEYLLKSILASLGMTSAQLNSTLRTYHDQARITLEQTMPKKGKGTVKKWYGQDVVDACETYEGDVDGMATWWEARDKKLGKVSSKHLSNRAMDVVPSGDRAKFAKKVEELVPVKGSGVRRIIPKGTLDEPVDHVEFTFDVTG